MWDSHCHLQLDPLFERVDSELAEASLAGVRGVVVPAYGPEQWERQTVLLEHSNVRLAFGIHPWCVPGSEFPDLTRSLDEGWTKHAPLWGERLVAVGEFGLDRSNKEFKDCFEIQEQLCRRHLELAERVELPVILHVVRCHGRALALLERYAHLRGVVHSYSGPPELVEDFLQLGLSLSYSGNIMQSEKARKSLKATPSEAILFETDGPAGNGLSNAGESGPKNLQEVLQVASSILGKSIEWCRSVHNENTSRVFRLNDPKEN